MMHHAAHLIERTWIIIMKILLWGVFLFLLVNTFIFFYYERFMYSSADSISDQADAVIILGASVQWNQLSQIVQDRAEAAIQVYQQKKPLRYSSAVMVTTQKSTTMNSPQSTDILSTAVFRLRISLSILRVMTHMTVYGAQRKYTE